MPLFMLLTRSTSRDALTPVTTSTDLRDLRQRAADLNGAMPRWNDAGSGTRHRVEWAPRGSAGGRWEVWRVMLPPNVELRAYGGLPSRGAP